MLRKLYAKFKRRICKQAIIQYENGRWFIADIEFKGCMVVHEEDRIVIQPHHLTHEPIVNGDFENWQDREYPTWPRESPD